MSTITTRQELLDMLEQLAELTPAEHVQAIPARRLAAEAPALAPLKMPKLSERLLNGKAVTRCVEAGEKAGIVHTPQGVRVVADLDDIAEDPSAVVLAQQAELRYLLLVDALSPLDAARFIIDREAEVIATLQPAA